MACADEPDDSAAGAGSSDDERRAALAAGAVERAASRLGLLAGELRRGRATRREIDDAVGALQAELTRILGPRPPAGRGTGGKAKILRYLLDHVGEVVHGEELAGISGIGEWARRVRELRVEEGYDIEELGRSRYRLRSARPDLIRADQWRLANEIRRLPGSATERIGRYLEANVGRMVTREQVDYVARIREGSRRLRELRDERGWPIDSHVDDSTLKPGEYRLVSADTEDRRDPAQRLYPEGVRQLVFERDQYTCQICGRDRSKAEAAGDSRFYLEIHHKVALADELAELSPERLNDADNLVTLCHRDHLRETAELQRRRRSQRSD